MRGLLVGSLTVAALALMGANLVVGARRALRHRHRSLELLRGVRGRHLWPAPFLLAAVVATFLVLSLVPPLRLGWWTLLGGQGNVVFGSTDATRGTVLEVLVPVVFIALLIPALPMFVEAEERGFRLGAERWSTRRRVLTGVRFGLVHLVVGIPVAAALALSLGGWWFTAVYLRAFRRTGSTDEALEESTRAHLGYDLVVVGLVVTALLTGCSSSSSAPSAGGLTVTSPDLSDGHPIPERFTCTGSDVAPTLRWTGGPADVKGWAVVVEDPDAPSGTFTHWVVTGLGPGVRQLGAGVPAGAVESLASSGKAGYVGPCPPNGQTHHYRFRVHALGAPLVVAPDTRPEQARRAIELATVAVAGLDATYSL